MNRAIRIIVSTIGVLLGIAGIDHGFFEILQGTIPTGGLVIQAIGDTQQMWFYGTEEAFTIVPNFLITGILAVMVSIIFMIWSVGFMHMKHAASVFFLLCVLLFLVGGGVAQIVFFVPTWVVATRIHKPLNWWRKVLPEKVRHVLSRLWPFTLTFATVSFLLGLAIAVFGYIPGVDSGDPDRILSICWSFVFGGGLGMIILSFVAGFADDVQKPDGKPG